MPLGVSLPNNLFDICFTSGILYSNMVNKRTKEDELILKLEKQVSKIGLKPSKSTIKKEEESVFWYDPKLIPLSYPVNHKKTKGD
jgi:hypothetical protein